MKQDFSYLVQVAWRILCGTIVHHLSVVSLAPALQFGIDDSYLFKANKVILCYYIKQFDKIIGRLNKMSQKN